MRDQITTGPITPERMRKARAYLKAARPALRGPYRAICREAARLRWPEAYRRDLTRWDRRLLMARDPALPFGWAVRPWGTHLLFPERFRPADSIPSWVRTVGEFDGHAARFYWFEAGALREVSAAELTERALRFREDPPPGTCART